MRSSLLILFVVAGCSGANTNTAPLPDFAIAVGDASSDAAGNDLAKGGGGDLVINEAYPHGADPATDPDWVEIKNLGTVTLSLKDYTLADSATTSVLPDVQIAPGGYALIVCDDAPDGGSTAVTHVGFKLSGTEDELHLKSHGNGVDKTSWGLGDVPTGKTWARLPDGTGAFGAATPTKLTANMP